MMAVHRVANPHLDAAVPEGLAAAVDLAEVERGDGIVEGHCCLLAQVFPAEGKVKARPASVSRIRNREEPSKTDHRRALRTFHGQKLEKHLTAEERGAADAFIEKHFCFLVPNEETETGLDWLLETMAATAALVGR